MRGSQTNALVITFNNGDEVNIEENDNGDVIITLESFGRYAKSIIIPNSIVDKIAKLIVKRTEKVRKM